MPPASPGFNDRSSNPSVRVPGLQKQASPPVQKSAFDQMKPSSQPIEYGRRNNIDQSHKILDNSPVRNPKQAPVVDAQRGSDAKQGKKLSSYGIFSPPKPVATNGQQFQKNRNAGRGQGR